jgi:ATP-dependent DNA helicase RecG
MTTHQLSDLIQKGETLAVEFKGEERAPLPDRDLLEAILCLANRPGQASGHLLLGVVYNLCTRLLMLNTSV